MSPFYRWARCAALIAAFFICFAPFGAATAQQGRAPAAVILIVKVETVLQQSAAGKSVKTQVDAMRAELREELRIRDQRLKDEEQALVELKKTLPKEEFDSRVRAFEQAVRDSRRAAQERGAELQAGLGDAMARLKDRLTPVLVSIMKDYGATILLDETQVILSITGLDVTEEVIRRFDIDTPEITVSLNSPLE